MHRTCRILTEIVSFLLCTIKILSMRSKRSLFCAFFVHLRAFQPVFIIQKQCWMSLSAYDTQNICLDFIISLTLMRVSESYYRIFTTWRYDSLNLTNNANFVACNAFIELRLHWLHQVKSKFIKAFLSAIKTFSFEI